MLHSWQRQKESGVAFWVAKEEWKEHFQDVSGVKAEMPFVMAFCEISEAVECGDIPPELRYDFQARCLKGRAAVGNCLAYVFTPLPLIYVHMIVTLVKLSMVMWSVHSGIIMGQAFDSKNDQTNGNDVWLNVILQIVMPVVYQSALELHRKLQNPFRVHSSGYPEATLCGALEEQCQCILRTGKNFARRKTIRRTAAAASTKHQKTQYKQGCIN